MKNIIKISSVLVLLMSVSAFADMTGVKVPANQMGDEANISYAGVQVKKLTSSTTEVIVSSKSCILLGVFASSSTSAGAYVVFRDTDAVNGSGTETVSTFFIGESTKSHTINPVYPLRFTKGMTATYTTASGGPGSVTVLYLER